MNVAPACEAGRRAGAARRVLEDAVLAARRVAAADRTVARAHVRRGDRDVDVGQTAGKILQRGHEGREVPAQVVLRQPHRRRVVDQEQQVDVAVHNQRDRALVGHVGHEIGPFDRARVAREQRRRERGEREPAERATHPATGTKRTETTNDDGDHADLLLRSHSNRRARRRAAETAAIARDLANQVGGAPTNEVGARSRRPACRPRRDQRSGRAMPHNIWPAK